MEVKMSVKEHEDKYWHIRKFGFGMPLLLTYFISTLVSLIWIINVSDGSKKILVIPLIILTLGLGTGWLLAVDKTIP